MILFLHHILTLLFHSHFLLAGTVLVTTGLETPPPAAETPSSEEVSTDDSAATTDDTAGDGEETETTSEGQTAQTTTTPEKEIDWRVVPKEVKEHLQTIAKENPKLSNLLQNAVYTSSQFNKEFPGGLKEAQSLKTAISEAGGLEEINKLQETQRALVEEQETLDRAAASGDPKVLDNLIEIAGEGFSKLMPVALDRWATADPDGYKHVVGRIMVSAMQEGGLVSGLNLAFKMLALNNAEATKVAVEELKKIAGWANGIGKIAMTPPEKPKVDPDIQRQQQELETEKTQIFNSKFSSQFASWRDLKIRDQVKTVASGKELTDFQMGTLANRVIDEVKTILTADPVYMKDLERVYGSRDLDSLLKFTKSRTEKILPEVVKKVYRQLFSNPGAKKATPAPKKQASATPMAAASTSAKQGWVKIDAAKAPSPHDIDNTKTDFRMKFHKQAILKDGRKVYWGEDAPK